VSDTDIQNDATPEALDNAANAALGMDDGVEAPGADGPASGADGPSASISDGPSSGSGKSSEMSVGGEAMMKGLSEMSQGQTLAKKKAAMGKAGMVAKGGSLAALVGTSILTGGAALTGMQVAKIFLDSLADNYRVRQTGQTTSMKDVLKRDARLLKGQGKSTFKKERSKINSYKPRAAQNNKGSTEDRILASRGKPVADKSAGASLQNNNQSASIFTRSKRQETLLRIRRVHDYGDQGVQKDAKFAPKAAGQKGINGARTIQNDAKDKLNVTMHQMRPNTMRLGM
jgi:hypothetical protein